MVKLLSLLLRGLNAQAMKPAILGQTPNSYNDVCELATLQTYLLYVGQCPEF